MQAQPEQLKDVEQVEQAVVVKKGILVLDRTGSMGAPRATGHTRCHDARAQAIDKANEFFDKYKGTALAVWLIDSTVIKLTGYVDAAAAKNAITSLTPEGCGGSTPLADGICMAIDTLNAEQKIPGTTNLITILSDGGENSSVGACKGNSNDQFDPGSWRFKARQKAVGAQPYVQINAQYWSSALDIQSVKKAQNLEPVPPLRDERPTTDVSAQGTCSSQDVCDHDIFLSLAADTGGIYDLVRDSNTQFPCTGTMCPAPYYEPIEW
jgi:hypothetical protein